MAGMKAIAVCGYSDSGKTALIERLIEGLIARGYRVASVKDIHDADFALDGDGARDTARHRAAGAAAVVARGLHETDILIPKRLDAAAIFQKLDADYVLLEGVRDAGLPMIVTAKDEAGVKARMNERCVAVSGVIANDGCRICCGLPVLHAFMETEALLDLVEREACLVGEEAADGNQ